MHRLLRSEMEERQRNFLAATAKRRAEENQETERLQRSLDSPRVINLPSARRRVRWVTRMHRSIFVLEI